jgi:hypothetical protein
VCGGAAAISRSVAVGQRNWQVRFGRIIERN